MAPELKAVVDRAKKLKPQFRQHLIATRQGEQFIGDGFAAMFRRAVPRAKKSKTIEAEFRFADVRSKSASDTSDLREASERLGHATTATTLKDYVRKPRTVKPLR